jgi:hypothetical protein
VVRIKVVLQDEMIQKSHQPRRAPVSLVVLCICFIGVENAFSPFRSGVEARVAHSDAPRRNGSEKPEWSLRNGGCVAGLPCDDENEGRGNDQEVSAGRK